MAENKMEMWARVGLNAIEAELVRDAIFAYVNEGVLDWSDALRLYDVASRIHRAFGKKARYVH
jgi:hypothetical protein